jgi:hypothetical protein
MVHQALGRGAMSFTQGKREVARQECITSLANLLKLLLPQSEAKPLGVAAQKIVDKALELKYMMMEEQALYTFSFFHRGEDFKEEDSETKEEEPGQKVLMCIFPGLSRTIIRPDDRTQAVVVVVKAMVNTTKAFPAK